MRNIITASTRIQDSRGPLHIISDCSIKFNKARIRTYMACKAGWLVQLAQEIMSRIFRESIFTPTSMRSIGT